MAQIEKRAYAEMFGPTVGDRLRLADTEVEGFTRDAEKFFEGGRNRANGQRSGVVADVAVMPHDNVE